LGQAGRQGPEDSHPEEVLERIYRYPPSAWPVDEER